MSDVELSYKEFKSRRKSVSDTLSAIAAPPKGKDAFPKDEKIFKYQKDKAGNAFIQLRFLPSRNSHPPIVHRFEHYVENSAGLEKKRTYWENCPTTIGGQCPMCDSNRAAWKAGNETLAKNRARKETWFANVFVIKDTNQPENNGKVFVLKVSKPIYNKIIGAMQPSEEDIAAGKAPVDVFDMESGANFCLKVKQKGGFANYDDSYFVQPSPLFDDAKEIEEVYKKIYILNEYIDPKIYKPYAELKKRMDFVYGVSEDAGEEAEPPITAPPLTKAEKSEKVKELAGKIAAPPKEEDKEDAGEIDEYFSSLEK